MTSSNGSIMLILSSPSGAGKTTLTKKIQQKYQNFKISVSHTTRAPRSNEVDGVDYHFVSHEKFKGLIKEDKFYEYAKIFENYYGTTKKGVDETIKNNDIIFSTEHGPDGGDEVNHNINTNDDKIENFGWAISSYGDHHYNYKNYQKEKLFPLYKSHSKYGFEEPLTYFYPSIGISEIVKIKNNQDDLESYNLLVASMGKDIEEGDLSLHYIKTDKYFKIIDQKILEIGQRIRDMIYVEKLNKVFMFFETSASVGFFTLQ